MYSPMYFFSHKLRQIFKAAGDAGKKTIVKSICKRAAIEAAPVAVKQLFSVSFNYKNDKSKEIFSCTFK